MADSGADGLLTNRQIVQLGSSISATNMKAIATGYMDINKEVVQNIFTANRGDQEGINRDVLEKWKNKPKNSGPDQVKRLASLLYQAADEGSYVDAIKIQKILNVSREELLTISSNAPVTEAENNAGTVNIEDSELTKVALAINSEHILPIAIGALGMKETEVGTVSAGARGNQFQLVFNILKIWSNRHSTANSDLRKLLYQKLCTATGSGFISAVDIEFLNQPPV